MNSPLVSIIIPCYNVEKYLKAAIESAIRQTYDNIEIILVDDGSTDGTSGLCEWFAKNNKNIYVIHKENGGLSSARNAGMLRAKGEFIYFLDSDDFIKDEMVGCLVEKMRLNELDVIFFGSCDVDESGTVISSPKPEAKVEKRVYRGVEAYNFFLHIDCFYSSCVPFYFYRKSFLDVNCLMFKEGILHEDELFSFEVYHYARRMIRDEHQFYYRRIRENSIMTSGDNAEKKFESTVVITDMVTDRKFLEKFSKEEYNNIIGFLNRILNLMCNRFNDSSGRQKRAWGAKYRRSLRKYIYFVISKGYYKEILLPVKRYLLSFYVRA